ncbi:hypothetical protein JXB02_02990 [Candidatus Woesearchaeota archaeon]|nr:hypothetical protein [Candidatus Woesearchaeota archaeon]
MGKLKRMLTNVRVIILLIALVFAVVAIHPNPDASGVAVRSVISNSSASVAGFVSPKPSTPPMSRELIVGIDSKPIETLQDYYQAVEDFVPNRTYRLKTAAEATYLVTTRPITETIMLNETEEIVLPEMVTFVEEIDGENVSVNMTVNTTLTVNKTLTRVIGTQDIGLSVYEAPTTNLRKGLDLQGGTRVLLQPQEEVSADDMATIIDNMKERLNVFGLSDVIVREARDLSGDTFILVEIAGANKEEVDELLAKQGKFEATIRNETVFVGGRDITYVCRSADCSGIDPMRGCGQTGDGTWACRFRFSISLTPEAAQRQADLTKDLQVTTENGQEYLNESLVLYLDDQVVDSLNIGADLRGRAVTDIEISGSGVGSNQQEATFDSLKNMKRLQTILITGSLPIKLDVVKSDSISPVLGGEFIRNALLVGALAIVAVALVIFARYRRFTVVIPIIITSSSEIILLLGLAALIGWNLDLAAIGGIIIAIGTGVDHQILITDEVLAKRRETFTNWKERIRNAFFIIMGTYFTTLVAMLPLWFAGAGLLKGFAITTIFGITFGVFITRPAYAAVIELLLKEE